MFFIFLITANSTWATPEISDSTIVNYNNIEDIATLVQIKKDSVQNKYYLWANVGIQVSFSENFKSLHGGQLGLNFSKNHQYYLKIKAYSSFSPNDIFQSSEIRPNRIISINNVSLLYGIAAHKTAHFLIIPSFGISYGEINYRGKYLYSQLLPFLWTSSDEPVYDKELYNYVGLPIDISFALISLKIGGSIDAYVNIHKHPDYGLTLNLLLGKICSRKK